MRQKSPYGYLVKVEEWFNDECVYYIFRDMLYKKLCGEDPYSERPADMGDHPRHRIPKAEKQRIFNSYGRRYPDIKKKMVEILKERAEDFKIHKSTRKSDCSCPFPFRCEAFPCDTLSCNADTLSNGRAYRMS